MTSKGSMTVTDAGPSTAGSKGVDEDTFASTAATHSTLTSATSLATSATSPATSTTSPATSTPGCISAGRSASRVARFSVVACSWASNTPTRSDRSMASPTGMVQVPNKQSDSVVLRLHKFNPGGRGDILVLHLQRVRLHTVATQRRLRGGRHGKLESKRVKNVVLV